jgi:hypothetical protein
MSRLNLWAAIWKEEKKEKRENVLFSTLSSCKKNISLDFDLVSLELKRKCRTRFGLGFGSMGALLSLYIYI